MAASLPAHPLQDAADRPPRAAHQFRDRGLGTVACEPRDLILKHACEPRVVPGPRDRGDDHTMTTAAHTRRVRFQKAERAAQVQSPPPATTIPTVIATAATTANPAPITLPPVRPDRHDHLPLDARRYILNHRSLQTKQPGPYPDTAHASVSPPESSSLREAGKPRSDGACAPLSATHPTHGNVSSALFGRVPVDPWLVSDGEHHEFLG